MERSRIEIRDVATISGSLLPRILLVAHGLPPSRPGGAELVTWRLARRLARLGAPVAILHPEPDTAAQVGRLRRVDTGAVSCFTLGIERGIEVSPGATAALSRVMGLWRPDVVWIQHLSGLGLQVGTALRRGDAAAVVTLHDYWWMCPRGQLLDRGAERCPGPTPDRCAACVAPGAWAPLRPAARVATAAWMQHRHREARATLRAAITVTAPSIHVADRHARWLGEGRPIVPMLNPAPRLARRRSPATGGPVRCAFFGSLLPSKGIEVLLDAAGRVGRDTATLELHGPLPGGPQWRSWRRHVRELAARSGTALRGPYAPGDVGDRMAAVEVVCLPSRWEENAPLVLGEAHAIGRAILASAVGGIPEHIGDGRSAWLLPPDDSSAWVDALSQPRRLRVLLDRAWTAPALPELTDRELISMLLSATSR